MHHVHGSLAVLDERFQRLDERPFRVGVFQRHRAIAGDHGGGGSAVQAGQRLLEETGVAQRGGHEQKARLRQREQRHLPGHAAVAVGVIMKFIHHHIVDLGQRTFVQCDVRENLGRAAENGRVVVHRAVAGAEAHVVRAELAAEREEFFIHQRLDGAGVEGTLALRDGFEMEGRGDERFAGARGRVQDDVFVLEDLEDGRLLRGVEFQAAALDVVKEATQQHIVAGLAIAWNQFVKCGSHRAGSLPRRRPPEKQDSEKPSPVHCVRAAGGKD